MRQGMVRAMCAVAGSMRTRTCLVVDLMGCLTSWTRSGGPSSRRCWSDSVRSSTEAFSSCSYILLQVSILVRCAATIDGCVL